MCPSVAVTLILLLVEPAFVTADLSASIRFRHDQSGTSSCSSSRGGGGRSCTISTTANSFSTTSTICKSSPEEDLALIAENIQDQTVQDFTEGDTGNFLPQYEPDAVFVFPNNSEIAQGKEAIQSAFEAVTASGHQSTIESWVNDHFRRMGDNYFSMIYSSSHVNEDGEQIGPVKFITIFRKNEDGDWKIIYDFGTMGEDLMSAVPGYFS